VMPTALKKYGGYKSVNIHCLSDASDVFNTATPFTSSTTEIK
jgi:hypothetical protein